MLKMMRTHMRKLMIATLCVVIPSFVLYYGYARSRSDRPTDAPAALTVNDETVDLNQYMRAKQNVYEGLRRAYGESFSEDLIDEKQLAEDSLDQLLRLELLDHKADKLALYPSEKSVQSLSLIHI